MDEKTGNREPGTGNRKLEKGADIAGRLMSFAAVSLRLIARLPIGPAARHIAGQWFRCATSAGANYEEARAGESRADFIHKVAVSAKEMREACYWIELVCATGLLDPAPTALRDEGRSLAAILSASARTAKKRAEPPRV